MKANISQIRNCYGCGVCAIACGQKIIDICLNENGFYEPRITDENKCTLCGICTEVCAFLHDNLSLKKREIRPYAAWSKNHLIRRKCSSGGVGFEIGKYLMEQGYKVCGVRYNATQGRAEHYIAQSLEELIQSIGSKYIQSYTLNGFQAIHRKEKYLVTGTPCQIDSFRRYIHKFKVEDNFILLDFFCHGVPTMHLWQKYIHWAEKQVGTITYASWRNKYTGWHDSWAMGIDGEKQGEKVNWHDSYNMLIREKISFLTSRLSQGDMFYALFLGDCCLGKQCFEHCKYKYDQSSADIRIGDCWGKTYNHNEDGVSAAVTFTQQGAAVLEQCYSELRSHPFSVIAEGQMKHSPARKKWHGKIQHILSDSQTSIEDVYKLYMRYHRLEQLKRRLSNPRQLIIKIIKKLV